MSTKPGPPPSDFDRRDFLRRAMLVGGVTIAAPVIVTLDATPASATPALVIPVPSPASGPINQTLIQSFPAPYDATCPTVTLIQGNLRRGLTHITSSQPKRRAHPWTPADAQATADCLAAGPPQKITAAKLRYRCCRQVGTKTCCRIVVIDKATCQIETSFDTCDGSLN